MRCDFMHFNELIMKEVIGKVGVEDNFIPDVLIRHLSTLILTNEETFSNYVEENYKLFSFDTLKLSEEEKKSLFARFIIESAKHFDTHEGVYSIKENRFNGEVYIPRYIKKNKLSLLKTNYFSRAAFVAGENDDPLLIKYKGVLDEYDSKNKEVLSDYYNKLISEESLFERGIITSQTVGVLIKNKEGYIYPKRTILGDSYNTLITGIVDTLNVESLAKKELEEEVGITKLNGISYLGCTIAKSISIFGETTAIHYHFIVEIEESFEEVQRLSEKAVDSYENDSFHLFEGSLYDFKKEVSEELSTPLKTLLGSVIM